MVLVSSHDGSASDGFPFLARLTKPLKRVDLIACLGRVLGPLPIQAEAAADGAVAGEVHVLFVDDNEVNRLLGVTLLENAGYAVATAADGLAAVEAVKRGEFALVFMDIKMPNMGGVEATHAIRTLAGRNAAVPIIAVTANAMVGDSAAYLRAGMNDYLSKPLDPHQFLSMARTWTRNAKSLSDDAAAPPATDEFDAIPLVSETGLGRLRAVMPAASLKTIIQRYLATDFLTGIEANAAAGEFEALGRSAHTCKGTSANIGAARLAAIASELDTACRTKAKAEVSRLLPQMRRTSDLTRIALDVAARAF